MERYRLLGIEHDGRESASARVVSREPNKWGVFPLHTFNSGDEVVLAADAQATIAALEETILKMGEQAAVVAKDAMAAKEQVAALQSRVQELEEWQRIVTGTGTDQESVIRLAAHEYTKAAIQCWKEANEKLTADLTQRTAECDALKLVNDTHMKTVMKLSHVVEQRTAERDTARRRVDELEAREVDVVLLREDLEKRTAELEAANKLLYRKNCELGRFETMISDLQAELERVRADIKALDKWRADVTVSLQRPEGAFFVDVPQHIKDLVKERDDLRTLILALPKVEGKIEVHTFKNTNQVVMTYNRGIIIGTLYGLDHAKPVAALYEHRQGMEG